MISLINSRIFLGLILIICIQLTLFIGLLIYNNHLFGNFDILKSGGMFAFGVSIAFYDLFMVSWANWIVIKYGNYNKFLFHSLLKERQISSSDENFKLLINQTTFTSSLGLILLFNINLIFFISLFPGITIFYNLDPSYLVGISADLFGLLNNNTNEWLWFIIALNMAFVTLSILLGISMVRNCKNFSLKRLELTNEIKNLVQDYTNNSVILNY